MKTKKLMLVLGMAVMMVGCGSKEEPVETETEISTQLETQEETVAESEEAVSESLESVEKMTEEMTEKMTEEMTEDDNFSVDAEEVKAFAEKIKEAVAAKDLEKLADMTAFPMYIGFSNEGKFIESKEDFLALGADTIFTEELVNSIAQADDSNLSPSMAGFLLTQGNDSPNILFQLRDGELAIGGINY